MSCARNACITACFSAGFSLPCSRPMRSPASAPPRKRLFHADGGAHVDLVAVLDDRQHDVGLPALGDLLAHERVGLVATLLGACRGAHRLAARRQVADHRDVEIAVRGQRQRAGNRRGRHDQDVGKPALAAQARALADAEAVLLVDDHEAETIEERRLLEHRVRADDQLRLSGRNRRERVAARDAALAAGEQRPNGMACPRAAARRCARVARRAVRSAPSARPAGRWPSRRPPPARRRWSCRRRRRPAAAGSSPSGVCRSSTISRSACFWPGVSMNGSTRRASARMSSDDLTRCGLAVGHDMRTLIGERKLEEHELLEDQPHLRWRPERIQRVDARALGWKVRVEQRLAARRQATRPAHLDRQRIGDRLGQARPARARRDRAATSASAGRCVRRRGRCGRCGRCRPSSTPVRSTNSYCGDWNCGPRLVHSTLPCSTTCCPIRKTCARKRWLKKTARAVPVASRTSPRRP